MNIDGEYYTVDSAKEYVEEIFLEIAEEYGYGDEILSDPEELSRLLVEAGVLSYDRATDAALLDKISSDGVSFFTDWVELCYYCEVY